MDVGLLGCGRMGAAIGGHLLAAGTWVAVYDPVAGACAPLIDRGAIACADPGEVASRSELVLIVVVDDAQTRDAVTACLETSTPGTILRDLRVGFGRTRVANSPLPATRAAST